MPGFGHALHTRDPRARLLRELAEDWGLLGQHSKFVGNVEVATKEVFGKTLAANVDGAIAGLMCDMKIDPALGKAFFIIGRARGTSPTHTNKRPRSGPSKPPSTTRLPTPGRIDVPSRYPPTNESEDCMAYGPAPLTAPPATTQETGTRQLSMAEAINEAIRFEMRDNAEIILLGQDIGAYGGTFGVYKGLFDEFGPERRS